MDLSKLFESLDEKVFTADIRESLETQFNEAVEAKAEIMAAARIDEKVSELEEKSNEHIEFLTEKAEEFVELQKAELIESIDKYLDRVVNEFLKEAQESLDESVKSEKADMIIEAFDSMLVATGVEVSKIVEAKDESGTENQLAESVAKYDALVEENISLKTENDKLIKMGIIAEMAQGLSIVESQKFEKLADLVEFTGSESYLSKLETIKESVKGTVDSSITESEKDDGEKPAWSHLV